MAAYVDDKPLLLDRNQASAKLGLPNIKAFDRHVRPHLPCIFIGRMPYFAIVDLEQWIDRKRAEFGVMTPVRERRPKPKRVAEAPRVVPPHLRLRPHLPKP